MAGSFSFAECSTIHEECRLARRHARPARHRPRHSAEAIGIEVDHPPASLDKTSASISGRGLLAADGILTFAFLGAIQAVYGPLVPGLKQAFGIDTTQVGLVFTAHGFGALLGILVPSLPRTQPLASRWLGVATALLLVGAAGLFVAPSWSAMLVAAFVLALGFGIHVVRLNSLFVAGFGTHGMTMSQLINAAFSTGSILGPITLGLSGEASRGIFGAAAILAFALLPLSVATDLRVGGIAWEAGSERSAARRPTVSRSVLAAFVAMMCLVVGVENSIGGWIATLALAHGHSYAEAANLTALFFGGILGGRLVAAWLGHRVQAGLVVVLAVAGLAVLLAVASLTRAGPLPLALAGFSIAPIFSATLVWVGRALPTSTHANAIVIAGALFGSALFPALIGRVIDRLGASAAPLAILALALAALGAAIWLYLARHN
jgi:FHS family glucose/mannose:H+ symporter-like MFS transporter